MMYVKEIWRYPVKSMAGESLAGATLTPLGIAGDRAVQVINPSGRIVTARSHPGLLGHKSSIGPDGVPLVDGRPWTDASVLADVRAIAGPWAALIHNETAGRFDVLPLLVATDGAIAAFGRDRRRLRPNIVIGGVEGLEERTWPGRKLRIGRVTIDIDSLRGRCGMTTYDPDTLDQDPTVLRDIVKRFEGKLALNCAVEEGGAIEINQKVEFV
ncbi:MAG: MOSC N-terminal beta barrel domain-containing protein [Bryobacterales bacterium]|nr:MOSC N-terminal beta barrel domain-containing protein [Bryobacterales bacterium]